MKPLLKALYFPLLFSIGFVSCQKEDPNFTGLSWVPVDPTPLPRFQEATVVYPDLYFKPDMGLMSISLAYQPGVIDHLFSFPDYEPYLKQHLQVVIAQMDSNTVVKLPYVPHGNRYQTNELFYYTINNLGPYFMDVGGPINIYALPASGYDLSKKYIVALYIK